MIQDRSFFKCPCALGALLIGLVVALGIYLRLYHLGYQSLWFDEGWTARVVGMDLGEIVRDAARDVHPPLYYLILHGWTAFFGRSEWALRLPSALFGILSLFVFYQIGRLLFEREIARLALMLMALSFFFIRYAQEARSYSLLALLALLSILFFLKFLNRPCIKNALGYLVFSGLLLYTHSFGLFVMLTQNIYLGTLWMLDRKSLPGRLLARWAGLQIALGLVFLPWIGILLRQTLKIQQGFWIPPVTLRTLAHTGLEYAGSPALLVLFLAVAAVGLWDWMKLRRSIGSSPDRFKAQLLCLLLLVIPNLVPFFVSKVSAPIYTTKSTIYAAPALYLLVACGIARIRPAWGRYLITGIIAAMMLASIPANRAHYRNEPWREAVHQVEKEAQPGDLVLFNSGLALANAFDYYARRMDLVKMPFPGQGGRIDEKNIKQLNPLLQDHKSVWVIFWHYGDNKLLVNYLVKASFDLSFHHEYESYYNRIEVYRFTKTK